MLAGPSAATLEVPKDSTYGVPMTYRAVPISALLEGLSFPPDSVIEAVATDGFAAQIPFNLVLNTDPGSPWPGLRSSRPTSLGPRSRARIPPLVRSTSSGPSPEASGIRSEYWAYQTAELKSQPSPATRWPEIAVDPSLRADDPIRTGQTLFVAQCMPCHKLNGAGASDVGPDLNRPMSPTEYMTPGGLHALIRDPKSVRTWPEQRMPAFPPRSMSDAEIDEIIAYLKHMAGRKPAP